MKFQWDSIPFKQSYRFNTLEESLEMSFNTPNSQKRELKFTKFKMVKGHIIAAATAKSLQ